MRAAAVIPIRCKAAEIAIAAGADGITAHLREDRRHIVDDDIARLKERITKPLNLEMAATRGNGRHRLQAASRMPPASFPSGGRSAPPKAASTPPASARRCARAVGELAGAGIRVSLFIAAEPAQIEAAAAIGAPVIEIHTGAWCDALAAGNARGRGAEFDRIVRGAALAQERRP